jgi:universal stress protein E
MTNKTILVVVDPGASEHPAVARAASLAEHMSAGLELFICDYDPNIAAGRVSTVWIDQPAREHLLSILQQKLETLAEPLRERGLDVATSTSWDHPLVDGIIRKVAASKPWIVVKDTHHHNVLKRTILSNTDWGLIRDCPAPLYLVKPSDTVANPNIYAAVDPTHLHDKPAQLDRGIVDIAQLLADGLQGTLHVVHSYAYPAALAVPEAAPVAELAEAVEEEHRRAFTEFLASYPIPTDNTHLLQGLPHETLPELTEGGGVDLIVMGAISRSGLDRVFVGNTAERVLDRLSCDLLIVKPEGFASSA